MNYTATFKFWNIDSQEWEYVTTRVDAQNYNEALHKVLLTGQTGELIELKEENES